MMEIAINLTNTTRKQEESIVKKIPLFGLVLASLTPLMPTTANAQITIDLLGIYQTEELCKNNPSLSDHKLCRGYYRQNRIRRTSPNTSTPNYRRRNVPQTRSTPNSSSNRLSELGTRLLYEQGDYRGALIAFDRAIAINPKDAKAYVHRGYARYVLKDYQGAIADANRAISLNSSLANAYAVRGNARQGLRDYQGAMADANQIIRLDASSPMGYFNRSVARYALANYRGALADGDRAVRLAPKVANAYIVRGMARLALGDERKALQDAERAVTLAQQEGTPQKILAGGYSLRSTVQYELGNTDKAMSDSRTAIALDRDAAGSMLKLAVILYGRGDRQESLRLAEKAISLDRNVADLAYLKERGWGKRLLADTKNFFKSPEMKELLAVTR
ncbi:hypothetical protein C7B64_13675 [Merismopedia glauca CCAP 1448/3]|uniref:Uncharacterized protein n=1 Tax=Merismopedia glauca CCAP 1448/3 TaxID=1296344 RepID=A0A2T1C2D4_9CYAN|nr:hypothetical protein C7B64_13675 [Merismopedia glauca CCAP 1448/3]